MRKLDSTKCDLTSNYPDFRFFPTCENEQEIDNTLSSSLALKIPEMGPKFKCFRNSSFKIHKPREIKIQDCHDFNERSKFLKDDQANGKDIATSGQESTENTKILQTKNKLEEEIVDPFNCALRTSRIDHNSPGVSTARNDKVERNNKQHRQRDTKISSTSRIKVLKSSHYCTDLPLTIGIIRKANSDLNLIFKLSADELKRKVRIGKRLHKRRAKKITSQE